jgi:type VI secretion system protein ImpC
MSVSSQRFVARHRAPRVQLQYTTEISGRDELVQLPFVTGVLADLSGNASQVTKPDMADRKFLDIDMDNFDKRMAAIEPAVSIKVANKLGGDEGGDELSVILKFAKMDDFSPAAVARQVPAMAKLLVAREQLSNLRKYMDGKVAAEGTLKKLLADPDLMAVMKTRFERKPASAESSEPASEQLEQEQQSAPSATPLAEADEFAAFLKQNFKPRTERAAAEVENAIQTLVTQALADTSVIKGEILDTIEEMIARLGEKLPAQMNEVLHAPEFQQLESAWRGLHYLVYNSETDATLKIRVLNVGKTELYRNLRMFPGVRWDQSPLFKAVYQSEFGTAGGEPYGALVADYYFSHAPTDIHLLRDLSRTASASLAPLIAGADPNLLGMDSWQELMNPRDIGKLMDTPDYAAWKGLRDQVDSRYVALALPRALARLPYGYRTNLVDEFDFVEDVASADAATSVEKFVWMNSAYLMAANINRAFTRYGWCTRIHGFDTGAAEQLPVYQGPTDDGTGTVGPTEIVINDHREAELAKAGLLALLQRKNADSAAFMSAPSVYKPAISTDPNATATEHISSGLPFVLASGRFAHYLKSICRDLPPSTHPDEITRILNEWVKNYVDENPETSSDVIKAQRPLASAGIVLREVESNRGYFECRFFIRPHYQFEAVPVSVGLNVRLWAPAS